MEYQIIVSMTVGRFARISVTTYFALIGYRLCSETRWLTVLNTCIDVGLLFTTQLSINQSINVKFVGRRYTRRPGAPTVVSGTHDQKVHS